MNYSHEQMNPLNCIIGNSRIVLKRFIEKHAVRRDDETEAMIAKDE